MKRKFNGEKLEKFKRAVGKSSIEGLKTGRMKPSNFDDNLKLEIRKEEGSDLKHVILSNEQVSHLLIAALEDAGVPIDGESPIGIGWRRDTGDASENQIVISFMEKKDD